MYCASAAQEWWLQPSDSTKERPIRLRRRAPKHNAPTKEGGAQLLMLMLKFHKTIAAFIPYRTNRLRMFYCCHLRRKARPGP